MKEKFIKFLEEHNCLEQYVANCKNPECDGTERYFADDTFDECACLNASFTLSATPEGLDFWYDLDDLWCDSFVLKKQTPAVEKPLEKSKKQTPAVEKPLEKSKKTEMFIQFLKDFRCLEEYVENCKSFGNEEYAVFDFSGTNNPAHFLSSAFTYSATPEGKNYWLQKNDVWLEKIK